MGCEDHSSTAVDQAWSYPSASSSVGGRPLPLPKPTNVPTREQSFRRGETRRSTSHDSPFGALEVVVSTTLTTDYLT